jgi:hypothetical protein
MKKLSALLIMSQVILVSLIYELNQPGSIKASARDSIEFSNPVERNAGKVKSGRANSFALDDTVSLNPVQRNVEKTRAGREKAVTFQLTEEQESNADRPYKEQITPKRKKRSIDSTESTQDDGSRKDDLQKQKREEVQGKKPTIVMDLASDRTNSEMQRSMTSEQQVKSQNIKNGFDRLTSDTAVIGVFKDLGVHKKFNEVMERIKNKADEQVTQKDLDSVQDFLKEVVKNKDILKNIDQRTQDKFLEKFRSVIQENFSDLSLTEMAQFLNAASDMKSQALEPQAKLESKKTSSDRRVYDKTEKQSQHKRSAKGGMPSSSDGILGSIFGLSFAAAIIMLMNTLANLEY